MKRKKKNNNPPALYDKYGCINPTRTSRELGSGGELQTSRALTDEGSVKPLGGTHLLSLQVIIAVSGLAGFHLF